MAVEVFANNAQTTLNGSITNVATSLIVNVATAFPTTGNFRILIDSELMLVTAVAGTTFTVTRHIEGTSAVSHNNLAVVTQIQTAEVQQNLQKTVSAVSTNTSNSVYTCDSTGPVFDYLILHNKSGAVSYRMPNPSTGTTGVAGREIIVKDITGAIETGNAGGYAGGNWIFLVPFAAEQFNGSAGFTMTGGSTYHVTNGSANVSATGSHFTTELAVGMSITFSAQAGVSYIVQSITNDTALVLTTTFGGTTSTTSSAIMNSLAYYANFGVLTLVSDGTNWIASSNKPLRLKLTAAGTFIPSPGCSRADLAGAGGGGGGGSGASSASDPAGGGGGGGALLANVTATMTPQAAITVAIGGGGGAGGAVTGASGSPGSNGTDSTFGALATFRGASGGDGGPSGLVNDTAGGGLPVTGNGNARLTTRAQNTGAVASSTSAVPSVAAGGSSSASASGVAGVSGARNPAGGDGGAGGALSSSASGGGGGGGGPGVGLAGGTGGAGVNSGTANAGTAPAANSGAGGGGGGGQATAATASGAGAAGGSGFINASIPM